MTLYPEELVTDAISENWWRTGDRRYIGELVTRTGDRRYIGELVTDAISENW